MTSCLGTSHTRRDAVSSASLTSDPMSDPRNRGGGCEGGVGGRDGGMAVGGGILHAEGGAAVELYAS